MLNHQNTTIHLNLSLVSRQTKSIAHSVTRLETSSQHSSYGQSEQTTRVIIACNSARPFDYLQNQMMIDPDEHWQSDNLGSQSVDECDSTVTRNRLVEVGATLRLISESFSAKRRRKNTIARRGRRRRLDDGADSTTITTTKRLISASLTVFTATTTTWLRSWIRRPRQ